MPNRITCGVYYSRFSNFRIVIVKSDVEKTKYYFCHISESTLKNIRIDEIETKKIIDYIKKNEYVIGKKCITS
jgi:hypothetical protein